MKRHICSVIPLVLLSFVGTLYFATSAAAAPGATSPASEAPETSVNVEKVQDGGTRISIERDMALKFDVSVLPVTVRCSADISLSYAQKNTIADVDGMIEYNDCAASSGDYTVAVTIRDEGGVLQTMEFIETWQRSDDQAVLIQTGYPIPENVDLIRVRTKLIHCVCADVPADSATVP